ncbi:YigZ family protein [Mycoplasma tauri]|uniref:YigZ family protein n=1 Tax=Mycoplasma tauri TaxID=547987 RepID=UPI001CBCB719|nr:YigZ family protein [Mycoplasma tauri]MBZ4204240.1 YigZ family protein [Mycoplasma tauri]
MINIEPQIYIVKKSKFISFIYEINSKEEVKKLNDQLWKDHKKATHICYAYTFFSISQNNGFNDDGEPSGTAGRPMLDLLNKRSVNNVVVFSVRYFGGIKLGGGGLIRAYVKSANLVIDEYFKFKMRNNDSNNR